jgi:hypothetical protein
MPQDQLAAPPVVSNGNNKLLMQKCYHDDIVPVISDENSTSIMQNIYHNNSIPVVSYENNT